MAAVSIPCGRGGVVTLVDEADAELVASLRLRVTSGYAMVYLGVDDAGKVKSVFLHRLLLSPPDGMDIDHINGNRLDNQRKNLRVCSRSENLRNRRSGSFTRKAPYRGIYQNNRRDVWSAEIQNTMTGVKLRLGSFDDPRDAAMAHDYALIDRDGDIARTNFSREELIPRAELESRRRVVKVYSRFIGVALGDTATSWRVAYQARGRTVKLGTYRDEETAALVFDAAAKYYSGIDGRSRVLKLNFSGRETPPLEELLKLAVQKTSAFVGVYPNKSTGQWIARCVVAGKAKSKQRATEEEAARAYDAMARHYLGETVRLNFPDEPLDPAQLADRRSTR